MQGWERPRGRAREPRIGDLFSCSMQRPLRATSPLGGQYAQHLSARIPAVCWAISVARPGPRLRLGIPPRNPGSPREQAFPGHPGGVRSLAWGLPNARCVPGAPGGRAHPGHPGRSSSSTPGGGLVLGLCKPGTPGGPSLPGHPGCISPASHGAVGARLIAGVPGSWGLTGRARCHPRISLHGTVIGYWCVPWSTGGLGSASCPE